MEVTNVSRISIKRNILLVAGVISTILGIVGGVPSFLSGNYPASIGATILIVAGLVLIAIAFGD